MKNNVAAAAWALALVVLLLARADVENARMLGLTAVVTLIGLSTTWVGAAKLGFFLLGVATAMTVLVFL